MPADAIMLFVGWVWEVAVPVSHYTAFDMNDTYSDCHDRIWKRGSVPFTGRTNCKQHHLPL